MEITELPLKDILPYARNPRKNKHATEKVASSIKEFGFRQPIVVDSEMVIVAGHTRFYAAKKLKLKTVPVHIASDLSPAKAKAYRIADNRTHEEAEFRQCRNLRGGQPPARPGARYRAQQSLWQESATHILRQFYRHRHRAGGQYRRQPA